MPRSISDHTRIGCYGIIIQSQKLLTVYKKSGPYRGLWDLPGGKIEFGESPEEALIRELREEVCILPISIRLLSSASYTDGSFHHLGFIYLVESYSILEGKAEEVMRWTHLNEFKKEEHTPFISEEILQEALQA